MKYWRRPKTGTITTVESYSHDLDIPGAIEITREEYDAFLDAIIPPTPPALQVFDVPVVAPDFIVQSPNPKSNHLEAHAEAIAEARKADKSIALIVLDLVNYVEELEKRLQKKNI